MRKKKRNIADCKGRGDVIAKLDVIANRYINEWVTKVFPGGQGSAPRAPQLKPSDVMLASYPRSGSTWVRTILAYLLYPEQRISSLSALNFLIPDVYYGVSRLAKYSDPRIIKTHQPFGFRHESENALLYRRNIYVIRHPYDVAISFFDFQQKLWTAPTEAFEVFVHQFLNGTIRGNSTWHEHVLSWKAEEKNREILFVRYEDLLANPFLEASRLANFLRLDANSERVQLACDHSMRDAVVKLAGKGSLVEAAYPFINKAGVTRSNPSMLTEELRQLIWERCRTAMMMFGYESQPC